ncbi:sigma-70 family RNA polymerase sigma factor [Geminocystis sp. CENA526]|uniref:sigma-70 family RNA polymerase sigma factor n=1 Tax=Geminocystis sp. CENA526 TaxID=1355871 RepID=UPI003D6FCB8B
MKMQKRTNLVTQFSSFLCLKEESSSLITYWQNTPELERNIQLLLQQQTLSPEADIIAQEFLLWLKQEQDNFKYKHLIAYLQESCFFATQRVYQRLKNYWDLLTWYDYFQWGNLLVSSPIPLLSNYDHKFQCKLTTYAKNKLENQLIDQAYQSMGWDRSSDWGLLKKLSLSKQRQCLEKIGGLQGTNLEQYLLVLQCFKIIYKSKATGRNKQLSPPSLVDFESISKEYNFIITNKQKNLSSLSTQDCQTILLNSIKFVRQYCNPRMINQDDKFNNLVVENQLNNLQESNDEQTEYNLVNQILTSAFAELENPQKILFQLWKGLQLTQTEVVEVMVINYPNFVNQQFQVAREISLVRQYLLNKLIQELFLEQNISLTKAKITELKHPLDDWLQQHCKELLGAKLDDLFQFLSQEEKTYIKEYLKQNHWCIKNPLIQDIQSSIEQRFKQKIIEEYQLVFPNTKHINISFLHFIEDWINSNTYSLINNS